ncbi:MAG: carboxypeptidase regulatory-like domain-containing protein [Thermoflexales bacterium]|nr:carboxypeptidase regulatory-like domain-containing protein [Thermoflexales bacterium]
MDKFSGHVARVILSTFMLAAMLRGASAFSSPRLAAGGVTTRVSVASNGAQGNRGSVGGSISADGRYVAFYSIASDLVSGDTNNASDVFVHDRQTGQTTRVSTASDGTQGDDFSGGAFISADGRLVAFESEAGNLVSGDTNNVCDTDMDKVYDDNCRDVFVHDRQTGQASRVSVASDGTQGDGESYDAVVSADGRYVAFSSTASNLVSGGTNNICDTDFDGRYDDICPDVFVHDRQTGQTSRVSVASDGTRGDNKSYDAAISADGRYVAFSSAASNLVSDDTNGALDVFVHDLQTGQTTCVSVTSDGVQRGGESASISADGRFIAFQSDGIWVHDRQSGQTALASVASDGTPANDESKYPFISADGRYVAFASLASNLVSDDTSYWSDVFVHDRYTGQTTRVSVASDGTQGDDDAWGRQMSADGRYVVFYTGSSLVSDDTNHAADVFVHDRGVVEDLYSISGWIRDSGGSPIADVVVSAGGGRNITTGAQGYYVMMGLAVGSYTLTPSKSGYTFSPASRTIDVPPSATDQDFAGQQLFIAGRVLDSVGVPVVGIQISGGTGYSATTDANGYYTFTNVLPGEYTLVPATPGYFWSPARRTVIVPPAVTGQDFAASTIRKLVNPVRAGAVNYGEVLTYSIQVIAPTAQALALYDHVPTYTLYLNGSLEAPPGVSYDLSANVISGTIDLAAAVPATVSFAVHVGITGTATFPVFIVNRACVRSPGSGLADCLWSNEVRSFTYAWLTYLPLVVRNN